ncbi:Nuclear speckle splicing regulatory protein 1 [Coemansia sp. RSA 1939]|nr:Nuclear speckle splicing regulatory protein 1 [Coemansia sp. RSA 1939]
MLGDTTSATSPTGPAVFTGGTHSRESAKLAKQLEETDPSVYAYDEVYDSISEARSRISSSRKKKDDSKPKYMEKLLETAKRRQVQQEVVKERVLEKERQREGEKYADKETFVTSAYKELKDQRQKLVEEEEKQEEEEAVRVASANSKSKQLFGASAGFYREFLDRVNRDDVSKAALNLNAEEKDLQVEEKSVSSVKSGGSHLNAGLNVVNKRAIERNNTSRNTPKTSGDTLPYNAHPGLLKDSGAVQTRHYYYQRQGEDNGHKEHERKAAESSAREREALIRKYARRNDAAAIEAARQRYFARVAEKSRQAS